MGRKEKLIQKLKSNPKDFTFEETKTLLELLGFTQSDKGRTSGSRVMFSNADHTIKIMLHKPHPRNELLSYQVRQLREKLEQEGLI